MAAGMKTMGPACCCCNILYVGINSASSNDMRRYDTSGSAPGSPAFFTYGRSLDFDPVHKRVFVVRGVSPTDDNKVFRYDEEFGTQTLLHTFGASDLPVAVTSDSDNEKVYVVTVDFPTTKADLHSINHDGTGYTSIGPLTNDTQDGIKIHYCRANGKLYYTSDNIQKLYRIDTDGSNDTLIASGANTNSDIVDCTIDNDNSRLFWADLSNFNGESSEIYRSDLDGAGATLILSGAPVASATTNEKFFGPQWSHKNNRLYFWKQDSLIVASADTANGWMSCDFDGSNPVLHIARGNGTDWWLIGTKTPEDWRLACGYETIGAGSTA